jgi:hypothetical protein
MAASLWYRTPAATALIGGDQVVAVEEEVAALTSKRLGS